MKSVRIIGIIWIVFSILFFYEGFNNIYRYSTPGILWGFITPIIIAYTKIICGIFCLFIGNNIDNEKGLNNFIILPFTFLLLIYLLIGLIQFGLSTIFYYIENILLLILVLVSFRTLKIKISDETKKMIENKANVIGILILGITPYLLDELTTYYSYSFLH